MKNLITYLLLLVSVVAFSQRQWVNKTLACADFANITDEAAWKASSDNFYFTTTFAQASHPTSNGFALGMNGDLSAISTDVLAGVSLIQNDESENIGIKIAGDNTSETNKMTSSVGTWFNFTLSMLSSHFTTGSDFNVNFDYTYTSTGNTAVQLVEDGVVKGTSLTLTSAGATGSYSSGNITKGAADIWFRFGFGAGGVVRNSVLTITNFVVNGVDPLTTEEIAAVNTLMSEIDGLLTNTSIGSLTGNVSQEAWDALTAIKVAQTPKMATTYEYALGEYASSIETMEQGIQAFKDAIVSTTVGLTNSSQNNINVYSVNKRIVVEGVEDYSIVASNGQVFQKDVDLPRGAYVVKTQSFTTKIFVK